MNSLIGGHFGRFLDDQPLMGSFALLARAPFALLASLAGGGGSVIYEAGVLACVLALCAVAFLLISRGDLPPNRLLLIPVLAILTPASRAAVESGHPEEMLAAALCVTALLLSDRRPLWAAVALGLALATKQWAVLAVIPVLLATPRPWVRRVALIAAAVAAILTVPLVVGNLDGFLRTSHQAGTSPQTVTRASVWFLVATAHHVALHLPAGYPHEITSYQVSEGLARVTHPAIVLLAPMLGLLVWRRRGDPLAFLALLLLARCVLDPVDNEYYHVPFLLVLLAFEIVSRRLIAGIPVMTLLSAIGLWLTFDRLDVHGAPASLTNATYLCWTGVVSVYLASFAFSWPRRMQEASAAAGVRRRIDNADDRVRGNRSGMLTP